MHTLAGIDLNLVVALHALLEEQNVTAAARRVGLSQPAMSHALSRLRQHFDDPLLIRSGRAMAPTSRGLGLLEPVRNTVAHLDRLMVVDEVDPSTLSTSLRWVTDDYIGAVLLPQLVGHIAVASPGVELDVLARGAPGRKALIRQGKADLAIGAFSGAGMDLHRQHLYDEDWVWVLRCGHPALCADLTVEGWAAMQHVIVCPTGGRRGAVDTLLQEVGLSRRVVLAVPHFHTALAVVAATDHVAVMARRLVCRRTADLGLVMRPPPRPMSPFSVSMLWHARTEHDPIQRWVRDVVIGLV